MALLAMLACALIPVEVFAHHLPPGMEDVDEFEDGAAFFAGLRHPFLGVDHWMFAVVVGALAALSSSRPRWVFPMAFCGGLGMGLLSGLQGLFISGSAWSTPVAFSAAVVLLLMRKHIPLASGAGLVAAVALWQGNAHGLAWPLDSAGFSYGLGTGIASMMLMGMGLAVVVLARRVGLSRRVATQVS